MIQPRSSPVYNHRSRQRGFTLVELVVVIVILGILGAVAAGRFFDRNNLDSRSYGDQTAALMRYAQKLAIAQNRDVFVRLGPGGIALCYNSVCGAGSQVRAPGGNNSKTPATNAQCVDATWACEAPPSGVTMNTTRIFFFDAVGKPFSPGASPLAPPSPLSTLAVALGGGPQIRIITVEAETGYVH